MKPMMILICALFLLVANAVTIASFAIDKGRAQRGEWRIAESTLLTLAFVGGSPGAISARQRFRHKTRKQPFATQLDLIAMLHAGVAGGSIIAFLI
jgi:uncharacterized membrane protein YsdA (DUF1294 family)